MYRAAAFERVSLSGPGKNGALKVEHIGVAECPQPLCHYCAAITDGAIDHDGVSCFGQELLQFGCGCFRWHVLGVWQVAHGKLICAPDIPQ